MIHASREKAVVDVPRAQARSLTLWIVAVLLSVWGFLGTGLASVLALSILLAVFEKHQDQVRMIVAYGLTFGAASYVTSFYWCWPALQSATGAGPYAATAAVLALAIIYGARFGLFGSLWYMTGRWGWAPVPRVVGPLVACETLIYTPFPHYFGYAIADAEPINQIAELGGGSLLTALCGVTSALISNFWTAGQQRPWAACLKERWTMSSLAMLGAAAIFGAVRLSTFEAAKADSVHVAVAHLGPTHATTGMERLHDLRRILKHIQGDLSQRSQLVDLTVIPESVYPILVSPESRKLHYLKLDRTRQIVIGGRSSEPDTTLLSGSAHYNSAFVTTGDGELVATHHKIHLVPFGEYLPDWWGGSLLGSLFPRAGSLRHGRERDTATRSANSSLGISICFEDLFPELNRGASPGSLLVNVTNDSEFHSALEARLHARLAVLRAIEVRRSMIRATRGGVSGLIDPSGRWVVRADDPHDRILVVQAELHGESTLFSLVGNWPALLAWILLGLGGFCAYRASGVAQK